MKTNVEYISYLILVFALLVKDRTQSSGHDMFALTAIEFFTKVCMSWHHTYFEQDVVIENNCKEIVAPTM